jgi:citrate lyase subunit beta/citryl-CoA lyase
MYNGISRIRIPKVTSKNDIENILSYINELAITRKINIPKLELMVENLEGLENLPDILNVYKQNIHAITVGGEDLLESLKAKFTNNFDIDVIKKEIVEISHTNNIPCLDTTFMNYKNTNAYKLDCMRSRNLGFDGRSIIHPNQAVDAIEVYSKGHGNV